MKQEPIAVIGFSCLFPGAQDPSQYWDLIESRRHSFQEVSPGRLGVDPHHIYSPKQVPDHTVSTTCAWQDKPVDLGAFDKTLPELRNWDPYYQWTFHLCSKALSDAR
ncbi:hypothetical protein HOF92_06650, partial [bacterium]|nr:hypothetical protein [bacterium]